MTEFCEPKDKKQPTFDSKRRYEVTTGKCAIHGDANYELTTQDSGQSFGFYQNTGQNAPAVEKGDGQAGSGGLGTGKHILSTPGMSQETVGFGLKLKPQGDKVCIPAKWIRAENGDIMLDAHNGDVHIRARNIHLYANGGGNEDGELILHGNRLTQLKGPDVRVNCEKLTIKANQEIDVITDGFLKTEAAFRLDGLKMTKLFGSLGPLLNKFIESLGSSKVGEPPISNLLKDKKHIDLLKEDVKEGFKKLPVEKITENVNELLDLTGEGKGLLGDIQEQLKSITESPVADQLKDIADNDKLGLKKIAENAGVQFESFVDSPEGKNIIDKFKKLGGL